jgi:transposase InsO family protein
MRVLAAVPIARPLWLEHANGARRLRRRRHSKEYQNALRRLETQQSTSRTGSCHDSAAAEAFFATIKTEIGVESWSDRATARRDIETWIKNYNERCLHSSLGYRTPIESRIGWQERMSMAA